MVQSVELLLDDDADAAVRRQWDRLEQAGVPSQARVRAASNRPHITMTVATEIAQDVDAHLAGALSFDRFPVRLGGVTVFGRRRAILVRAVVPSTALLAVHRHAYEHLAGCPGIAAHTAPGEWTPHVTLARRVPPELIGVAIAAVLDEPEITGSVVAVRRWDGTAKREWQVAPVP